MTRIKKYKDGHYYGIQKNDGTWMKCLDGKDWYSTMAICQEVIEIVIPLDRTKEGHTAGPWSDGLGNHILNSEDDEDMFCVAEVSEDILSGDVAANKRLIIAAPELFDACKTMYSVMSVSSPSGTGQYSSWLDALRKYQSVI